MRQGPPITCSIPRSIRPVDNTNTVDSGINFGVKRFLHDLPDSRDTSDDTGDSESSTDSDDSNVSTMPFESPDAATPLHTQIMIY